MTAEWDVVVIGSGPAGAVASHQLARIGLKVLLVDQATFPRSKICGSCLNANALNALHTAGLGNIPARLGAVTLKRVSLAAGGRTASIRWTTGVSVSRSAFDMALIQEAMRAGVTFQQGVRAIRTGKHVRIGQETVTAQVVIAADGLTSRTVDEQAVVSVSSRIGAGVILPENAQYEPGTVFLAVARGGYVGLVRLEDGRLDVAAAMDTPWVRAHGGVGHAAAEILRIAGLPEIQNLAHADWKGTPPLTRHVRRVSGPGWFAIGDAAGYVEPFTGEGIGWAITSAMAVAPLVKQAVREWDEKLTHQWSQLHQRLIRRRQQTCRLIAWALRRQSLVNLSVRTLACLPGLAAPIVASLHRSTFFAKEASR